MEKLDSRKMTGAAPNQLSNRNRVIDPCLQASGASNPSRFRGVVGAMDPPRREIRPARLRIFVALSLACRLQMATFLD